MKTFIAALALLVPFAANSAPILLDGMGMQKQWTDNEGTTGEMPDFVWGDSDTAGADKIGMYVDFADGTTGSIVYSGVAPYWNTSGAAFPGVTLELATGFFASYTTAGLHFLYNTVETFAGSAQLPIAWANNPSTAYGGNVELDYNDSGSGSQFRISGAGWTSVEITTYSSSASAGDVPAPATLALLGLGLAGLGWKRRKQA